MCRLNAFTATNLSVGMRRIFFDQLMLVSQTDDNQKHGAGMTDGIGARKSNKTYQDVGIQWVQWLNPQKIWHGHVRKASQGTLLTPNEAHPFMFTLDDKSVLFASHNGGIYGFNERVSGDPDVDSYRAFKSLVAIMNADKVDEITADVINKWTALFGFGSEWSFMIMHKDKLHVIRGNRAMFFMRVGNGFMFNTSSAVLYRVRSWINEYWGSEYRVGEIVEIADFHLVTLEPGTRKYQITAITPQKMPPPAVDTYLVLGPSGTKSVEL